jgi:hypothetical protein
VKQKHFLPRSFLQILLASAVQVDEKTESISDQVGTSKKAFKLASRAAWLASEAASASLTLTFQSLLPCKLTAGFLSFLA